MAVFIGASPEDLEVFAGVLDTQASALVDISGRVSGQLSAAAWAGADMEHFSDRWTTQLSGQLHRAAALLVHGAQSVRAQAEQQRHASSAAGPAGGGGGGPWLGAWDPARRGDPRSRTGLSVEDVRTGWSTFDGVKTVGWETPERLLRARTMYQKWLEVEQARLHVSQVRNLQDGMLRGVLRQTGDPESYPVLRQWYTQREAVRGARQELRAAKGALATARGGFVEAVAVTRPLGRVFGGLGVVAGVADFVAPSGSGWHRQVNRYAGGASAIAGSVALVAGTSLLTLNPVGLAVVGGVLFATSAWSVYENWDSISHGATAVAGWAGDKASDAAGWAGDKASDAAGWAGGKAKDAGKAVGHKVSGAWQAVGGMF